MRYSRALPVAVAFSSLFFALALPSVSHAQDTQTPPPPTDTPPPAPERARKPFRIGPEIGVFLPTSGETRDTFGSSWFNYGIGLGNIQTPNGRGRISFDLNFFSSSRGGNRVFMAPIGVGYRLGLHRDQNPNEPQTKGFLPYVGASANIVFADMKSDTLNIRSGIRTTGGISVLLGSNFGEKAYAQIRYLAIGKVSGFDLSGTSLTAGLRF